MKASQSSAEKKKAAAEVELLEQKKISCLELQNCLNVAEDSLDVGDQDFRVDTSLQSQELCYKSRIQSSHGGGKTKVEVSSRETFPLIKLETVVDQ